MAKAKGMTANGLAACEDGPWAINMEEEEVWDKRMDTCNEGNACTCNPGNAHRLWTELCGQKKT